MSQEAIKEIIARAMTDDEYKETLFSDPDKALEGYELTEDETSALKELENEHFDATAGDLEERVSFGLASSPLGIGIPDPLGLRAGSSGNDEVFHGLAGTQTQFEDFVGDLA